MATPDVDEINKIRKAVGLPLLPSTTQPQADGPSFKEHHSSSEDSDGELASTLETREAAGFENFKKIQDDERRRIEREQRKKQIQKARDAAARLTKLEGKGLGDVDDGGDLDAKSWLKGAKKRQAKIERDRADKLAEELAERERLSALEYTSADLAGVQVAHEIGDFENGESEQILTLQDSEIRGNEEDSDQEDVLENAEIVARDKTKEKLNLKKKKAYDVNDDSEEKGLLSQYDEKKRKAFTLDGYGAIMEEREPKRQQIGDRLKNSINMDILKPEPVSDYLEVKIKKPKKSKKKNLRQRDVDEEDDVFPVRNNSAPDIMEVDQSVQPSTARAKTKDTTFNDDEDLANALSFSRRAALKKQKRKAEDIVKQLKAEEDEVKMEDTSEAGLTLDDTTNFLDNLSTRPREEQQQNLVHESIEKPEPNDQHSAEEEDEDEQMGEAYNGVENEEELLDRLRREQSTHTPDISHSGLSEEQTLSQGLGATLNLLKQRGLVKDSETGDRNALYKDRQKFIIEARLREHENEQKARLQRERDRQSGKMANMSAKEREEHARWQNTQREHHSSIQAAAAFNRDYKPDVQIKYVDDSGRLMNQKEAFKHLSHQFHGKGSGKQKTEKHLKKIDDEKRRMATSVLDSSKTTGMNNVLGTQTKKNKAAGVRLG